MAPACVFLFPLLVAVLARAASQEEDILPGWKGESHHVLANPATATEKSVLLTAGSAVKLRGRSAAPGPHGLPANAYVVRLSWKPRAFLYRHFLTPEECDHIVAISIPKLKRSTVVDPGKVEGATNDIRTSFGLFLDYRHDDVITSIEDRIADWTFLPVENQENMQVLRYNFGQKYESHYDALNRTATVLMYLSDVDAGGETVFPNSEEDKVNGVKDETWSDCGKRGVAVKPRKGDILLFFDTTPEGGHDTYSMHAGCPVISGQKWSATKWIHPIPFQPVGRDPADCKDYNENCAMWATAGECKANPSYMIGRKQLPGACRLSCMECLPRSPV